MYVYVCMYMYIYMYICIIIFLYIISQITHSRITFLQWFCSQSLTTITKNPVLKETIYHAIAHGVNVFYY
jgi:hypothetical protein